MGTTRRKFIPAAASGSLALTAMSASGGQTPRRGLNSATVTLPQRNVPVMAEADVVVCGGGTAGISAAYCAARHGAKVIMIERWPSLGGMATNALVNIWHTSDRSKQVIHGFVQEAVERGGRFVQRMSHYPKRPETHVFDPAGMRVVFYRMLKDAGVRILCNLTAVESIVEGSRMACVLVDTKTGRKAVRGRIFIDATGDGDVAANAGLPFDFGRAIDGGVQGMTMMFRVSGLKPETVKAHPEDADRTVALMKKLRDEGGFPQFLEAAARNYLRNAPKSNVSYNMCPAAGNPLDEEELTRLSEQAREHVYQYLDLWRKQMPGFEQAEVDQMGIGLGVRESRRIRGMKTLDARMVVKAIKQPDAIGHGFWMVDIHDPKGSGYTTWVDQQAELMPPLGDSYHIPLGICLNERIPNLAVVGRCISATHEALASVRLQSHCMVMGQGVGTCAALALNSGVSMAKFDVSKLQSTLHKDGVYLESVPARL